MSIDDLDGSRGEFVARAPTSVFPLGSSRTLTSNMQAASDLAASVFVVPIAPPLAPVGVGQKNISAPAQPPAPLVPAGTGQTSTFENPRR